MSIIENSLQKYSIDFLLAISHHYDIGTFFCKIKKVIQKREPELGMPYVAVKYWLKVSCLCGHICLGQDRLFDNHLAAFLPAGSGANEW